MESHPLAARLSEPGPKRLLSLDGGGLRGLISIGFLARMEDELRAQYGRKDLVLSDHFDLIGGTSTGAIIAALLALGKSVDEIRTAYMELGRFTFRPRRHWLGPVARMLGAKFDAKPLEELLQRVIGDVDLGSPELRTGLMVVARRVETSSVWPLVNVPGHRHYEQNKDIKLWQAVRASTAAPTYFRPHWLADVGDGSQGVFVDGGVSMHNNPAMQLLMVATLDGFNLRWPLGAERMLLCSVGTGAFESLVSRQAIRHYSNLHWLALLIVQLMEDASELNRTMLQWMSRSPTAETIDRQIGDLSQDDLHGEPLVHYLRYDLPLSVEGIAEIGLKRTPKEVALLREMSNTEAMPEFLEIGEKAAAERVMASHFPEGFMRGAAATST